MRVDVNFIIEKKSYKINACTNWLENVGIDNEL